MSAVRCGLADSNSSRSWSGNPSAFPKNNQSSVRPGIFCTSRIPMFFDNGYPSSKPCGKFLGSFPSTSGRAAPLWLQDRPAWMSIPRAKTRRKPPRFLICACWSPTRKNYPSATAARAQAIVHGWHQSLVGDTDQRSLYRPDQEPPSAAQSCALRRRACRVSKHIDRMRSVARPDGSG